jgi:hypothetical protein
VLKNKTLYGGMLAEAMAAFNAIVTGKKLCQILQFYVQFTGETYNSKKQLHLRKVIKLWL